MRLIVLLAFLGFALSQNLITDTGVCFAKTKLFYSQVTTALEQKNIDSIIDSFEKLSETVPSVLRACGEEEQAVSFENQYPPVCTKLLAREAKLFVKIMKLYAQDQEKNEKQILMNTAMLETIYKTQVQKKCPFLAEQNLMEVKDKGQCAEGAYRYSLVIEQLDNDLSAGKFNKSLTDMESVVEQLPVALDLCNQHNLAKLVRNSFPEECLNAIGGLVRETVTIEHHYTHLQWLQKHLKDFTRAVIQVRVTCPALEH